jgi:hypothetical protein
MNYYGFRLAVQQQYGEFPHLRIGQVYFGLLEELRPDLAEKLRGSPHDPFYKTEVPIEAEQLVEKEWDNSTEFPLD